jgi:hypothetical protein
VYLEAWAILKSLQIPAIIFLATGYLDSDAPTTGKRQAQDISENNLAPIDDRTVFGDVGVRCWVDIPIHGDPVAFEDLRACGRIMRTIRRPISAQITN